MDIPTIEVPKAKLEALEKEHEFLQQIRALSHHVEQARTDYLYARDKSLEKKKAMDTLSADLNDLISGGPPKPDPQGRLPFASEDEPDEEDEPEDDEDEAEEVKRAIQRQDKREVRQGVRGEAVGTNDLEDEEGYGEAIDADFEVVEDPPKVETKKDQALPLPTDIKALDLTERQKGLLANTGALTMADLVDLGNGNWKNYPKGFASIKGLGGAAIAKLVQQLPSTAAEHRAEPGEMPAETKKIKIMTFAGQSDSLQPGDTYEATVRDDNVAIVSLPGQEPVEFQEYEYELVG